MSFLRNVWWFWLAAGLLPLALHCQQPPGTIRVEVKDPSGAPMEAAGSLHNLATGVNRRFRTGAHGTTVLDAVASGRYRLDVGKRGFAAQSELLEVTPGASIARTFTLALGGQAYAIEVVGATPLPGVERTLAEIPAPVQVAAGLDLESSGARDLSDFLNRRLSSVYLNEIQGNPAQPDLNYRGYTASPLLGTPQGISVYMDGVRLNQPFGDVVSWDLIPRIAIAEMALIPGSNPLFGLNTLGGALAVQTKDGHSQPGTGIELSGGSFGRKAMEIEHGSSTARGLSWYIAGSLLFEDGWRDYSPANVRQFLAKPGWQGTKTTLSLTLAWANNLLTGNGLQEQRFVTRDYSSVYTRPDITGNRSPFFNLGARHSVTGSVAVSGNAYYRDIRTRTVNADLNDGSLDQAVYQPSAADIAALTAAGYRGFPIAGATAANTPFPYWRCIAQALQKDEPVEKCNGVITRTRTVQHNGGISGQVSWFGSLRRRRNQFTAGTAYNLSSASFLQNQQFAYLNPDHTFTAVNAFADGTTNSNGAPYDTRTQLDGRIRTASVYVTDTLAMGSAWSLTVSGRYNRTTVRNSDLIRPAGGAGSLNSNQTFGRLNPAAGVTYNRFRLVNAYVSYSEGSRAPTSIELGCADPAQPCKLPNAMAGDPPLRQVVARTVEAGIRGSFENHLSWNAGWFRGGNSDDLLFVASTQTGYGYFKNFGRTRRKGVELDLKARAKRFTTGAGYTLLDATYQNAETVNGSSNSATDATGAIHVRPGDRVPLVPRGMGKAFADVEVTSKLGLDVGLVAVSSAYARGNENNLHQPDGIYYLGPGTFPGYAVVNLGVRYELRRGLEVFANISDLFDRHYYTAAQLLPTGFSNPGNFVARPFPAVDGNYPLVRATFYAPGAPRGAWVGMRIRY